MRRAFSALISRKSCLVETKNINTQSSASASAPYHSVIWHHNTPHYSITSHHTHHTLRISHPSSLSWHAQAGRCTRSRMHADTRGRGKKYLFLRVHACTHMHMTVRDSRGDNRHKHTTHATALFPNKLSLALCLSLSLSVSISQNRRDLLLMGGRDQDFLLSSILADISTSPLSAY